MKTKILTIILSIVFILGVQSCVVDPENFIEVDVLNVEAINLTSGDGQYKTLTVSKQTIINKANSSGVTTEIWDGDILPVKPGDEIEFRFIPSVPEQTEAFLTMPDGNTYKVSSKSPSCKWVVPDNFTPGMQIRGRSDYKNDRATYNTICVITLVAPE